MSTQAPSKESTPTPFMCDCEEFMRQACAGEGFYRKKEGKRYCVLHYPGDEKVDDFQKALHKKQSAQDYNFRGVWFPKSIRFKELQWGGNTDFSSATFNEDVDFSGVEFKVDALFNNVSFNAGADFRRAIFSEGADFRSASFSVNADFSHASFNRHADFLSATFSAEANFVFATFSAGANFARASFNSVANFIKVNFSSAANFRSVANFRSATFSAANFNALANFNSTTFSVVADFEGATFNALASFIFVTFSAGADFEETTFSAEAEFRSAIFSAEANFLSATFGAIADFRSVTFDEDAIFYKVTFKDYVYIVGSSERRTLGDHPQLNLQFAHFEKSDRVSFHTLNLKPHWFVNADSRKFEFTEVEFRYALKDELKSLKKAKVSAPHGLLAIAFRHLAVNAEENHRYRQAANLRYASMDAQRLEWLQDRQIKKFQFLHWLYWIASGYGERINRAVVALVILWLLFAFFYTKVGFENKTIKPGNDQQSTAAQEDTVGKPLPFKKVFTYSLGVISLQKPDPKPVTIAAQTLVILETILCPLQAALLALAIRRRFMR